MIPLPDARASGSAIPVLQRVHGIVSVLRAGRATSRRMTYRSSLRSVLHGRRQLPPAPGDTAPGPKSGRAGGGSSSKCGSIGALPGENAIGPFKMASMPSRGSIGKKNQG